MSGTETSTVSLPPAGSSTGSAGTVGGDSSQALQTRPVSATQTPPARPRKRERVHGTVTPGKIERIIVNRMDGLTLKQTAKAVDLCTSSVQKVLNRPEVHEQIVSIRETIRHQTITELLDRQGDAWKLFKTSLEQGSTKDADNMARVLLNMEKIASSASGEARKLETVIREDVSEAAMSVESQELLEAVKDILRRESSLPTIK